jgi:hypothetical protein
MTVESLWQLFDLSIALATLAGLVWLGVKELRHTIDWQRDMIDHLLDVFCVKDCDCEVSKKDDETS